MPSLKAAAFPDIYLFDNFQNQVTFTLPLFAKLTNLIKFVNPVFWISRCGFSKTSRGCYVISKQHGYFNFNGCRVHKNYFKVGQKVISKWGRESYMKKRKILFQRVGINSNWSQIYIKVGQFLQNGVKCYFKV